MPDEKFWQDRYEKLGVHSVGPGDTMDDQSLEEHRQYFVRGLSKWLPLLKGPVMDFGCGVGRWVSDLPRPYLGLDLLPEHIEFCKSNYSNLSEVSFSLSNSLSTLPENHFNSIFTCTVLQHIVEPDIRYQIIENFSRVLSSNGCFLSIEWASGQKEYDWCKPVKKAEFSQSFSTKIVGEVVENGRRHTIWVLHKKKPLRFFFF